MGSSSNRARVVLYLGYDGKNGIGKPYQPYAPLHEAPLELGAHGQFTWRDAIKDAFGVDLNPSDFYVRRKTQDAYLKYPQREISEKIELLIREDFTKTSGIFKVGLMLKKFLRSRKSAKATVTRKYGRVGVGRPTPQGSDEEAVERLSAVVVLPTSPEDENGASASEASGGNKDEENDGIPADPIAMAPPMEINDRGDKFNEDDGNVSAGKRKATSEGPGELLNKRGRKGNGGHSKATPSPLKRRGRKAKPKPTAPGNNKCKFLLKSMWGNDAKRIPDSLVAMHNYSFEVEKEKSWSQAFEECFNIRLNPQRYYVRKFRNMKSVPCKAEHGLEEQVQELLNDFGGNRKMPTVLVVDREGPTLPKYLQLTAAQTGINDSQQQQVKVKAPRKSVLVTRQIDELEELQDDSDEEWSPSTKKEQRREVMKGTTTVPPMPNHILPSCSRAGADNRVEADDNLGIDPPGAARPLNRGAPNPLGCSRNVIGNAFENQGLSNDHNNNCGETSDDNRDEDEDDGYSVVEREGIKIEDIREQVYAAATRLSNRELLLVREELLELKEMSKQGKDRWTQWAATCPFPAIILRTLFDV